MATPILANSCASATTAAESRFRVEILPRASWRVARVMALDTAAAAVVQRVAEMTWHGATFFAVDTGSGPGDGDTASAAGPGDGAAADMHLRGPSGTPTRLSAELEGADLVVMVATADDGASAAAAIGVAAALRGIMTAGLILDGGPHTDQVVSALRPYARVLMVTRDEYDVAEVLHALRA